jgi:hypothetical protein
LAPFFSSYPNHFYQDIEGYLSQGSKIISLDLKFEGGG